MNRATLLAGVFACSLLTGPARAQIVMLQPFAASTNMGTLGSFSLNHVIDQSGLSTGYTSLSTDFATYTGASPTHNASDSSAIWFSATGTLTGHVDFDLGGTYSLQRFALWSFSAAAINRIVGFELLASADNTFATTTNLGTFTSSPTGTITALNPEVFTLPTTSAAFVRMVITSNNGATTSTGFSEVAFGVTPVAAVPEPSSLALAGVLGALGAAWRMRTYRRDPRG